MKSNLMKSIIVCFCTFALVFANENKPAEYSPKYKMHMLKIQAHAEKAEVGTTESTTATESTITTNSNVVKIDQTQAADESNVVDESNLNKFDQLHPINGSNSSQVITNSYYDNLLYQMTNHNGDKPKGQTEVEKPACDPNSYQESYIQEKNEARAAAAIIDPADLPNFEVQIPLDMSNRASQYATISASFDGYSSEGQWTVLLDLYGDGNLYYACLDDDCYVSGWQYGSDCGNNTTCTMSTYFFEGYDYYLGAYDSWGDGGTSLSVTGDDGAVWATHESSSGSTYSAAFTTPSDAPPATCDDDTACNTGAEEDCTYASGGFDCAGNCGNTAVSFNLVDSYGDGWNGGLISFNGDDLTINTGDNAKFDYCLADGDYSYSYTAGSYASENSWTVEDDDGTLSAGLGSSGSASYDFSVGGTAPVYGCTDSSALNYDSDANADDGSCTYACSAYGYASCNELAGGDDNGFDGGCIYANYVCDGDSATGTGSWGPDCDNGADEGEACCDTGASAYGDCSTLYDCNGDFAGGASEDCAGTCGGSAAIDDCGVCDGDGTSCACDDLTVCMTDSYGDSWNGNVLTIGTWSGANDGSTGTDPQCESACIDLTVANDVACGGGSYQSEVSWSISDANGELLSGGAPYAGCIGTGCPAFGCTDPGAPNYDPDANADDGTCESYAGMSCDGLCDNCDGMLLDCTLSYCWSLEDISGYTGDDSCNEFGYYGTNFDCAYFGCDGGDCADCNDECNGTATEDCNDVCGGTDVVDDCGVCGGDGSSCACTDYTLVVGGGSYDGEISWDLGSNSGVAGTFDLCLGDGNYTFNGYDSWGDGWNGASAGLFDAAGTQLTSWVVSGSSGSWDFILPSIPGCTLADADNYNADANNDDGSCNMYPGGPSDYWFGSDFVGGVLDCSFGWSLNDQDGDGIVDSNQDGECDSGVGGSADLSCAEFNCDAGDCIDCDGNCGGGLADDECGVECGDGSSCACDGDWLYLTMADSWGDGWNGNEWCLNGADCVTIESGASGSATYCVDLSVANQVTCGGGDYQSEVSWSLAYEDGSLVASGGAPYDSCIGFCGVGGCMDDTAENYNPDATFDNASCTWNGGCSSSSYAACDDGTCIYASYFCDGWVGNGSGTYTNPDCTDGSDETEDCCGIGDDNYTEEVCAADCNGNVFGGLENDCAGICDGDTTNDACGNCGGDCEETVIQEGGCVDTNYDANGNEITDGWDGCADYVSSWCGDYDTTDFISGEMCCLCGGGDITEEVVSISCGDDEDNAVVTGCDGVCGSGLSTDDCGVCDGGNADMDCCDVCGGDDSSCSGSGDVDDDGFVTVNDIIIVIADILATSPLSGCDINTADVDNNGAVNIMDVIAQVDIALSGGLSRANSSLQKANSVKLIQTAEGLSYEADGFVGFEIILSHGVNFEINMTKSGFIASSNTVGTTTKIVVVNNETSELFSSTGNFEIVDVIAGTLGGTALQTDVFYQEIPTTFGLSKAYPNPFNPTTSIGLAVPVEGFVSIQVYNLMGQVMATLHEGNLMANSYEFTWDATDAASGVYFIQAEAAGNMSVQKIMYMK